VFALGYHLSVGVSRAAPGTCSPLQQSFDYLNVASRNCVVEGCVTLGASHIRIDSSFENGKSYAGLVVICCIADGCLATGFNLESKLAVVVEKCLYRFQISIFDELEKSIGALQSIGFFICSEGQKDIFFVDAIDVEQSCPFH